MASLLLTPEQRQIIGHPGRALLIGAVAGSGKTTTLAHCVAHRERQGMPARDILVLVFTPAAEQVFRQRLSQASASRHVRVATYPAYAKSLLDHWQEAGAIDGATVYLESAEALRPYLFEAIELASEAPDADPDYRYDLTNLHAEILLNQMSRLKGTLAMRRFDDESDDDIAESLDLPRGLVAICRQYERMRCLDWGSLAFQSEQDLVYDALGILSVEAGAPELPRHALIVADEWHDANAGHVDLLAHLTTQGTRVIAAGDREQVIHTWNGADPRYMGEAFLARFPGTERLPLTASFRCGATLSAGAAALTGQPFTSSRATDTDIQVTTYTVQGDDGSSHATGDCALEVLDTLMQLNQASADARWNDCAVLLRDHHQSIELENMLIEHGVPYQTEGFSSYFDRVEVRMLRGILHIVQGTIAPVTALADVRGVLRALGMFAGLRYSEAEWVDAERTIARQPDTLRDFHRGQLTRSDDGEHAPDAVTRRWRERFATVCDALIAERANWNAGRLLAHAAAHLNIADTTRRLFVHQHQADAVSRSIAGFITYAARTGLDAGQFLASLDKAQARSSALKKHAQRLTLSTVRDAKGKEWKHVLLPWLARGEFPDARAESGEERRLFYVAITRASDTLTLFTLAGETHPYVHAMRLAARPASAVRTGQAASVRTPLRTRPLPPSSPAAATPHPPTVSPQLAGRVYLDVPYEEKDAAKQLGAQWDNIQRKWWITPAMPTRLFQKWLRTETGRDA
ncbi:3'-5' exonuclease [Pigmentiphaga litoralis]|uniref:3'-5' exonuclease n=1 Tax=Pigmentiphaga litoralis TaxID=516702 RepID=UPI003B435C3F